MMARAAAGRRLGVAASRAATIGQLRLDRGRWGTGSRSARSGRPGSPRRAAPIPRATAAHRRSAASRPGSPVAALALPDVRITPAALPPVAARWARLTWTGAAAARLDVKTPAAGTARPSVGGHDGHVGGAGGLDPGRAPAATNPCGAVTLTGTTRRSAARSSRAARVRRWRTGWPGPTRPSPGCRAHRTRAPSRCAGRPAP